MRAWSIVHVGLAVLATVDASPKRCTSTTTKTHWGTATTTVGACTVTRTPAPTTTCITRTHTVSGTGDSCSTTADDVSTVTPPFTGATDVSGQSNRRSHLTDTQHLGVQPETPRRRDVGHRAVRGGVCTVDRTRTRTVTRTVRTVTATRARPTHTHVAHVTTTVSPPCPTITSSTTTNTGTATRSTTTSWSTVAGPVPTVCGADNMSDGLTERGQFFGVGRVYGSFNATADATARACCLSCVTKQGCAGAFFDPQRDIGLQCNQMFVGGCTSATGQLTQLINADADSDHPAGRAAILMNGYCGSFHLSFQR